MLTYLEKNKTISLILTIMVAGLIYYLSSLEFSSSGVGGFSIPPYLYHFGIFFLLGIFLLITIKGENETETKYIIIILIIAILYAASDEFHQNFVPGRDTSVIDFLIDTLGVVCSNASYKIFKKIDAKISKSTS